MLQQLDISNALRLVLISLSSAEEKRTRTSKRDLVTMATVKKGKKGSSNRGRAPLLKNYIYYYFFISLARNNTITAAKEVCFASPSQKGLLQTRNSISVPQSR